MGVGKQLGRRYKNRDHLGGTPPGLRAGSSPSPNSGRFLSPSGTPGRPLAAALAEGHARGPPRGRTPSGRRGPWRRRSYLVSGASSLWSGGLTAVLLSTAAE